MQEAEINLLLREVGAELEEQEHAKLSAEEKRLHALAQKLLRLERDLKVPGACKGIDARIDRLLDEIDKEKI